MGIPVLGDIIDAVQDVASEAVVDVDKRAELDYKLEELRTKAQTETNLQEAKHESLFVAGWRPAVGWVGVFGLGYSFVLAPLFEFVAKLSGWVGNMPELQEEQLMVLVTGLLGFGGFRTFERVKGVARQNGTAPVVKEKPTPTPNPQGNVGKRKGGLIRKIGKLV